MQLDGLNASRIGMVRQLAQSFVFHPAMSVITCDLATMKIEPAVARVD
jgi:hypothetical protein